MSASSLGHHTRTVDCQASTGLRVGFLQWGNIGCYRQDCRRQEMFTWAEPRQKQFCVGKFSSAVLVFSLRCRIPALPSFSVQSAHPSTWYRRGGHTIPPRFNGPKPRYWVAFRDSRLSGTLSADVPFASPRGSIVNNSSMAVPGGAAPTAPEDATPGFTPVDEPPPTHTDLSLAVSPPPVTPGSRNYWLYVPLLHAAAGRLAETAACAWRMLLNVGERWALLVASLRNSQPVSPNALARLIRAIAELDAREFYFIFFCFALRPTRWLS